MELDFTVNLPRRHHLYDLKHLEVLLRYSLLLNNFKLVG